MSPVCVALVLRYLPLAGGATEGASGVAGAVGAAFVAAAELAAADVVVVDGVADAAVAEIVVAVLASQWQHPDIKEGGLYELQIDVLCYQKYVGT